MNKPLVIVIAPTLMAVLAGACGQDPDAPIHPVTGRILQEGLTCAAIDALAALDAASTARVREELIVAVGAEGLGALIEERARDCGPPAAPVEVEPAAITGTWAGEGIEETAGTGGRNGVIYRDSAAGGWICNSGQSGWPADYVARFNLPGAWANRGKLRVRGTSWFASCYLPASSSARVYSDNDVDMCIGYWSVMVCGAIAPASFDTAMWLAP